MIPARKPVLDQGCAGIYLKDPSPPGAFSGVRA